MAALHLVDQFLRRLRSFPVHQHPDLPLLGADHHRLLAHPAHQVERRLGLAAQGLFQHVVGHALIQDLAQLVLDLEKAVGRAQTPDALVRPLVVVVLHPQPHPFPRLVEAVELGPAEELPPDRLPQPLDLPQRHGMVRLAANVPDPVLAQLPLEPRLAPPVGVLPPVIGEHLLGHPVLRDRPAIDLQDVFRRLGPK